MSHPQSTMEHMFDSGMRAEFGSGDEEGKPAGSAANLVGLAEQLLDLTGAEMVMLSDEHVCAAALATEQARRFLDSVQMSILTEMQQRGVTDQRFGLRTGPWLAREAQLPSSVAKSRARIAAKVSRHLPAVAESLANGKIGFDHAKVIADVGNPRIIDQIAQIAPALCDAIEGVTFDVWRNDVQAIADLLDRDGGHDPSGDVERNRLTVKAVGDVTIIRGELVGAEALIANEALNAIADELFDRFKRDNDISPDLPIPDRQTLMALALVEACRRGLVTSGGKAPRPEVVLNVTPADLETTESPVAGVQCSCDGSVDHGEHRGHGDHCDHGAHGDPSAHGDPGARGWGIGHPPRPLVEAVAQRLSAGLDTWGGMWVTDSTGTPLKESTWKTLLCDPDFYTLVVNSLGVPLDMGDRIRFANRAQRRALAARDGGCVFPGCTAPSAWTEAHHIVEWRLRNSTDTSGLLSLCRHHHGVAHRKGWSVDLTPDGWSTWTSPSGDTFEGQRHGRRRPPP